MLRLRIQADQVYTYGEADFEEGEISIAEELTAEGVEPADVTLMLHGTFLGCEYLFDLPSGADVQWRAELNDDETGAVYLNGLIRKDGIVQEPLDRRWSITLMQAAGQELIDRLEDTTVAPASSYAVDCQVVSGSGNPQTETLSWYPLRRLLDAVADAAVGVDLVYPGSASDSFPLDVEYQGEGGARQTIHRGAMHTVSVCAPDETGALPGLTGAQILEAFQAMTGMRIGARYAPWPSEQIIARFLPDTWTEPAVVEDLDGYVLDDGYELSYEPADAPDFGVAYANELEALPISAASTSPFSAAVYEAERRRVQDARPSNDNLLEIPFHIPDSAGGSVTVVQPDPAAHPFYIESVAAGVPVMQAGKGLVYCAAIDTVGGQRRMVIKRSPTTPAPGQAADVCEAWATTLFAAHQMKRAGRYLLSGRFDIGQADVPETGTTTTGVRMLARGWMIQSQARDIETGEADLVLVRPDALQALPPQVPAVGVPSGFTVTRTVIGEYYIYMVDWQAPAGNAGQEPAVSYDLEWSTGYSGPWVRLQTATTFTDAEHQIPEVLPIPVTFHRVRAIGQYGGVSAWIYGAP